MDVKLWKNKKKELHLTFNELSLMTGVARNTIIGIFQGTTPTPRIDTVRAIERALGIDTLEESIKQIGGFEVRETYPIPLVGEVHAGKPIESEEYLEGYVYVDYHNPSDYFALRVKGDSMINAHIFPDSTLIVRKQNYAVNGDIIVAIVDGGCTVKRYAEKDGLVVLMPENPSYSPIIITEKSNFIIFGKVVEIRSKI